MEKKERTGLKSGVLGEDSPEGCWLPRWTHRGPGCMGRRQTSDSSGTMG